MALRVIADGLLVNAAVLTSMAARFVFFVAFEGAATEGDYKHIFWDYLIGYRNSAWLLTLICLSIFYLSGFYTYGRAYQGRYKALVITHAVSLAYTLFGFLSYFTNWEGLRRGTLLYAWILSVGMLVVARVWSSLWRNVVRSEIHKLKKTDDQKISNVLVIGGAGYIGSALLPKLLEKGYNVRLLDLFLYGSEPI
jgi:FlaA1/EpsC-like NDP-sugar epimerase